MQTLVSMNNGEAARAVWVDRGLLYAGGQDDTLRIVDLATGIERKAWTLSYLVSDIAIVGDQVFAALGNGHLVAWQDRGLGNEGVVRKVDANAPKLAVAGDTLLWGTAWGEIHELGRGRVVSVKKWLYSVAADRELVYAGYEDGKVRVFRRSDGKRVQIVEVGGKACYCATAGRMLYTISKDGQVTRWRLPGFERDLGFSHDVTGSEYGIVGLHVYGDRVITRSYEELAIHDATGTLIDRWRPPAGRIEDVWCEGGQAIVAAGPSVLRWTIG